MAYQRNNVNSNNSNSGHKARAILPNKPVRPTPPKESFYNGYGHDSRHSTEARRSGSQKPPPAYQTAVIADLDPHSSLSARDRRIGETRASQSNERTSGRSSPKPLSRSPSCERLGEIGKEHTSATHGGERSSRGPGRQSSSRKRLQSLDRTRAASPSLDHRQYDHREVTQVGKQASNSPMLKRSTSFSIYSTEHADKAKQSQPTSSLARQNSLRNTQYTPGGSLTDIGCSRTTYKPTFPCTISPTTNSSDAMLGPNPAPLTGCDGGRRAGLDASQDTTSSYPHVPGSPRPRNTTTTPAVGSKTALAMGSKTALAMGSKTAPAMGSKTLVTTPPSPHTSAPVQSPKPRTTSTSAPTGSSTLSSPPHTLAEGHSRQPRNTSPPTVSKLPSSARQEDRDSTKAMFPESGGRVGLANLGNTCFMNSMLQCLGQTGEMSSIFLHMESTPANKPLIRAYRELMQQMWSGSRSASGSSSSSLLPSSGSIHPRTVKDAFSRKNPQFSGFDQHDSQEFMRFLVSGLHEDLKEPLRTRPAVPTKQDPELWWEWYRKLERSELLDVFVGQLCSSLTCLTCQHCSMTFDPFWELSVSLPRRSSSTYSSSHGASYSSSRGASYSSSHGASYSSSRGATSYSTGSGSSGVCLQDCLNIFTAGERLDGDEKPFCESCQCQEPGVKKMTIQRLPPVLVIHLKRFSGYGRRSKLDTSVIIPHSLNISDYTSSPSHDVSDTEYELYAVSNHSGTVYFGHYTAWCKHYSSHRWFSYNDSQVSPLTVQTPTFSSTTAYVLFYRQITKNKVTRC